MGKIVFRIRNLICIFLIGGLIYSCNQNSFTIDDTTGTLSKTNAPVSLKINLNKTQKIAAKEGRLNIRDLSKENETVIPTQLEFTDDEANSNVLFLMSDGESGKRKFELIESKSPINAAMKTVLDPKNRQIIIEEAGKKVLQYNYQMVYEKDVIRPENKKNVAFRFSNVSGLYFDEYLKTHPKMKKDTLVTSSIYSVPRSDYIHPLYGLKGEMLTRDWPDGGHPHHRGIFWAWPEVEYGKERGDIYALQRVFSRPTGNIEYTSGPVYAEINAENLWMWEDSDTIVNEHAVIRVYRSTSNSRIIDLTIKLLALKDSVTIATRFTNSYGGLNIRMQTPEKQKITYFTDEANAEPLRAWSDFNGIFEGNKSASGLMVLQHRDNPGYPGSWREYPDLAWVQPTFPTPNTRYLISKTEPLILRYRLIIYAGGKPSEKTSQIYWDAYHLKTITNSKNL